MAGKSTKSKSKSTPSGPSAQSKGPVNVEQTIANTESDPEYAYEMELCWCIQKLKCGLNNSSQTKNKRQAEVATKILKTLENPNTEKPKKRLLMRSTFGDYREKMKQEAKTFSGKTLKNEITIKTPISPKGEVIRHIVDKDKSVSAEKVEFTFDFSISGNK